MPVSSPNPGGGGGQTGQAGSVRLWLNLQLGKQQPRPSGWAETLGPLVLRAPGQAPSGWAGGSWPGRRNKVAGPHPLTGEIFFLPWKEKNKMFQFKLLFLLKPIENALFGFITLNVMLTYRCIFNTSQRGILTPSAIKKIIS